MAEAGVEYWVLSMKEYSEDIVWRSIAPANQVSTVQRLAALSPNNNNNNNNNNNKRERNNNDKTNPFFCEMPFSHPSYHQPSQHSPCSKHGLSSNTMALITSDFVVNTRQPGQCTAADSDRLPAARRRGGRQDSVRRVALARPAGLLLVVPIVHAANMDCPPT